MKDEGMKAIDKQLRDEIKRAVIIYGQGTATYREIMESLAKVNMQPTEPAMSDGISGILGEDFKLVIKYNELAIECTEILKALDDVSCTDEEFSFVKREEGGFKIRIETVEQPQE